MLQSIEPLLFEIVICGSSEEIIIFVILPVTVFLVLVAVTAVTLLYLIVRVTLSPIVSSETEESALFFLTVTVEPSSYAETVPSVAFIEIEEGVSYLNSVITPDALLVDSSPSILIALPSFTVIFIEASFGILLSSMALPSNVIIHSSLSGISKVFVSEMFSLYCYMK